MAHLVTVNPLDVRVETGTGVRSKSNSRTLAPLLPSKEMCTLFGMSFYLAWMSSQTTVVPSVLAKGYNLSRRSCGDAGGGQVAEMAS